LPAAGITGYIQHQYTDLEVQTSGAITVSYNGNNLGSVSGLQSLGLGGLGLVVGKVYPITLTGSGNSIQWFSERYRPAYVAPPTYADGTVFTEVELSQTGDAINKLINYSNFPFPLFHQVEKKESYWRKDVDSPLTVFTGYGRVTGDEIEFRYKHTATALGGSAGTNSHKSRIEIKINGQRAWRHAFGQDGGPNVTADLQYEGGQHARRRKITWVNGFADISSLGLSLGTIYKWEVILDGTGTSKGMDLTAQVYWLASRPASGAAWSALPLWPEGGNNISATNMALYKTAIERLTPNSGAAVSPLYYDNFAQFTAGQTHRWGYKYKKYIVYVWDGKGTPTVVIAPDSGLGLKGDLAAITGARVADLDRLPGLFYGDLIHVDDVYFAVLTDDVSQLSA
jgi:hypothetical protein